MENNKLICPFCQQEMRRTNGTHNKVGVWQCQNSNDPDNVCIASGYLFNDDVLNYITRTRKALDVAKDTIIHTDWFFDGDYNVDAKTMHNEIKYAIKAITALTKGGDNE